MGAVVSVMVVLSMVELSSELLVLQEITLRLKRIMRIINNTFFIFFSSAIMRENKFEKSHIHILESKTLSRQSRVSEYA